MCATVFVDSSMPTQYSQDLRWQVLWFVWNLGLTRDEVAFYLGVSLKWTGECCYLGDTKIKRSLFN